jgi:hypothetical protein
MSKSSARVRYEAPLAAIALAIGVTLTSVDSAQAAVPPAPSGGLSGTYGLAVSTPGVDGARGTMTDTFPFELPAARGDAQPTLQLSYSSERGTGEAGESWSLNLPSIQRAPLSGWPKYLDDGAAAAEDRYTFAGQPLTYVCGGTGPACPPDPILGPPPDWASGHRWYRLQVDTTYARFFLSPTRSTWTIQFRGGVTMELGAARTRTDIENSGIDADAATGKPFRWNLVRLYDRRGARNLAIYWWQTIGGRKYLRDIYYTPPAASWSTASPSEFAYHVQLSWENPPYLQIHYAHQDKRRPSVRLRRVAVSNKTWSAAGDREFLRAYNLAYYTDRSVPGTSNEAATWNRSFLREIKAEPRCAATEINGIIPDTNCTVPTPITTTFEYQPAELNVGATLIESNLPPSGFGPGNLPYPTHATIVDINNDGLPDIVQGWPQNYNGTNYAIYHAECSDSESQVERWIRIREAPGSPRPFNPQLVCHEDEAPIRSARVHTAYVNRGPSGAGLFLQHNCLDAGDGTIGTLTRYQVTPPGTTEPTNNPVALFSQWGAEVFAPFGDALMLWSAAEYRSFAITPTTAATSFCSQASGAPQYPAMRWTETDTDDIDWARRPVLPSDPTLALVDIDGDGYPDRLGSSSGATYEGLQNATVRFTRRLSKLEQADGPALVPFESTPTGAAPSASPMPSSWQGIDSAMGFYADINGDGVVDLISTSPVFGDAPRIRPGDGRGHFGCETQSDPACIVPGSGNWLGSAYRINVPDPTVPWPLETLDSQTHFVTRRSYFRDVTGDGLADLVSYQFDTGALKLWVNIDGHTFRCANVAAGCVVATLPAGYGGPAQPLVTFADFDGNGVEDFVLVGHFKTYHHSFVKVPAVGSVIPRAPRPGLLKRIRSGTGVDIEISYATIQELDLAAQDANANSFNAPWTSHVPTVIPVVTEIDLKDTGQALGAALAQPYGISRTTHYSYRNPAYDLWTRGFRGFRRVRTEQPSGETLETRYWFGDCDTGRIEIPSLTNTKDCSATSDDHADKAFSGIAIRTDRYVGALEERRCFHRRPISTSPYPDMSLPARHPIDESSFHASRFEKTTSSTPPSLQATFLKWTRGPMKNRVRRGRRVVPCCSRNTNISRKAFCACSAGTGACRTVGSGRIERSSRSRSLGARIDARRTGPATRTLSKSRSRTRMPAGQRRSCARYRSAAIRRSRT